MRLEIKSHWVWKDSHHSIQQFYSVIPLSAQLLLWAKYSHLLRCRDTLLLARLGAYLLDYVSKKESQLLMKANYIYMPEWNRSPVSNSNCPVGLFILEDLCRMFTYTWTKSFVKNLTGFLVFFHEIHLESTISFITLSIEILCRPFL